MKINILIIALLLLASTDVSAKSYYDKVKSHENYYENSGYCNEEQCQCWVNLSKKPIFHPSMRSSSQAITCAYYQEDGMPTYLKDDIFYLDDIVCENNYCDYSPIITINEIERTDDFVAFNVRKQNSVWHLFIYDKYWYATLNKKIKLEKSVITP